MAYKISYILNDKKKELAVTNDDIAFNIVKTEDSITKLTLTEDTTDAVKYSDLDKVWEALKSKEASNVMVYLVMSATKQEFLLFSLDTISQIRYNFQLNKRGLEENQNGIPIAKVLTLQ